LPALAGREAVERLEDEVGGGVAGIGVNGAISEQISVPISSELGKASADTAR
jgi:hypothetical protein